MFGKKVLSKMSFTELTTMRREIDARLEPMREEAMANLRKDMEALGVDYEDLKPPKKKRDVQIKYRDPDNPENTWSGMGKPKKWLQAYLDQGRKLEEFGVQ